MHELVFTEDELKQMKELDAITVSRAGSSHRRY